MGGRGDPGTVGSRNDAQDRAIGRLAGGERQARSVGAGLRSGPLLP